MHQYDILATGDRILRPNLGLLKGQRREVNTAELHRVSAVPDPFLKMALQDDIRMRQQELELLITSIARWRSASVKAAPPTYFSPTGQGFSWG